MVGQTQYKRYWDKVKEVGSFPGQNINRTLRQAATILEGLKLCQNQINYALKLSGPGDFQDMQSGFYICSSLGTDL